MVVPHAHSPKPADQIQLLGPATCFWAYPMERYIGTLKSMVSLMSNIDKDLSNRVITMEFLNHLPNRDPTAHSETADPRADYPFAPSDPAAEIRGRVPVNWERLLFEFFGDYRGSYPEIAALGEEVVMWRKYHVLFDCTVGSELSLGNHAHIRRDDSYVWWTNGDGEHRFGRAVVFFNVYDWEALALVRPYREVEEGEFGVTIVKDEQFKAQTLITVARIGGLVGRIRKEVRGRMVTFLVGRWYEPGLIL